jgi:ATP phosphoribosyltransferase regulatory subunit
MMERNRWLLPEGVEELLPPQAEQLEGLRAQVLGLFNRWGYELVVTPLIEYIESLLIGRGDDLDLQTYKLIDQLNGRLMGVRADITPQVARIDAHHLRRNGPTRLCYVGQVLHTRPDGLAASREPIQVGAELYGHAGIESDLEIIHLMVETLRAVGVNQLYLDLGHVGIFRSLARKADLAPQHESALFEILQRKAKPDMHALFNEMSLPPGWREVFLHLVDLNGDAAVLTQAQHVLAEHADAVGPALDHLTRIAAQVHRRMPGVPLHFDLAELRGYHYKTGIVFAAFVPGHGKELARGGRYDDIGGAYGRARPATGFSADLKTLIRVGRGEPYRKRAILAPLRDDSTLEAMVKSLRDQGQRVVWELPGHADCAAELGCDRVLAYQDGQWQVVPLRGSDIDQQ